MREFFHHYLLGRPAPPWLEEGVPHLKLEEHLEERTRDILPFPFLHADFRFWDVQPDFGPARSVENRASEASFSSRS